MCGHDVAYVREDARGADDATILSRARREQRLVLTFDLDFGSLAVRSDAPEAIGVILLRLAGSSPELDCATVVAAIADATDWLGSLVVVEDDRVRVRDLRHRGK